MMGMRCGFVSILKAAQATKLTQSQKLTLKQMFIQLQCNLHPDLSQATKGLPGMILADKILRERNACGLLIGGLSERVWNQRRKPSELLEHKDVDVLVLSDQFKLKEPFEGGIDWWLPQKRRLRVWFDDISPTEMPVKFWKNGFGCNLRFGIEQWNDLPEYGLYVPEPDWVIRMRESEALAGINQRAIEVDYDETAEKSFKRRMQKKIKTKLPKFISKIFGRRTICEEQMEVDDFGYEVVVAMNK